MARPRFGTDGLRGVANVELTPELAMSIGRAAASVLGSGAFVVGRDTRQSGPMIQAALAAGMAAEGADVADLGVLPTGGVAHVAAARGVPAAVVSASHNPFADNGIKLFDAQGTKLSPGVEELVEAAIDASGVPERPGGRVGVVSADASGAASYLDHLVGALDGRRLDGLSVVLDCAHGAAFEVAPTVFAALGASVHAICVDPDGTNINAGCGSTRPEGLASTVLATGADFGLAFDGDADRLVAVDHAGHVVDGDALMALFAVELHRRGELSGGAVAVTIMSNLGFRLAMEGRGIEVVETPVGDRHVLAAIDKRGLALGGEQSGHIVFRRLASTGDGVLSGLLLADAVAAARCPLAELAGGLMERVPQVLVNVAVDGRGRLDAVPEVWEAVARAEAELQGRGRVLLRPSGTEPLVRVMVEAPTEDLALEMAQRLSKVVEAALGTDSLASMCGIIGVAGADGPGAISALGTIMDGLRRLEYRGYDSAGVALVDETGDALWRRRAARDTESVQDLERRLGDAPVATTGVGHTRWATHGRPNVENAHPHVDCTGRVALVHNGIIENHAELAAGLVASGHRLVSETDTEVLAHLVEEGMAAGQPLTSALRGALAQAKGSFAVAVVSADQPGVVAAGRRSAPLLVALGVGSGMVASDVAAVIGVAERFYALEDDQVAEVGRGTLTVTTFDGAEVEPTPLPVDPGWDLSAAQKGGFDDFMSKEIHEQPQAVADTLLDRRGPDGSLVLDELHLDRDELRAIDKIVIAACGSSYHAGLVAKYAIERWVRLPTEVDIASELRYRDPVLHERTLVVGVSQSGETLDTLEALREARKSGARTLAVTNVGHSMIARESDGVIVTRAGFEIGVASTKCHVAQIVALELLALALAQWRGTMAPAEVAAKVDAFHRLPAAIEDALGRQSEVEYIADVVASARDFFFLGRHVGYPVAMEGALKLKEISYLRAEGYPAGELKHGPIALIVPGTVVVGVLGPLADKMALTLSEVASRGATVVVVAEDGAPIPAGVDHVLRIPAVDDPLMAPVVGVVPLQLLAYGLARRLGNNVDRPRNLAKTVTVELSPISGIGVDAVDVARFGEVLARRPGIAGRLFTAAEQTAAAGDPQRLAARFAAKEATMKALGTGIGGFGWHDVELVRPPLGAPTLRLHAAAATLAEQRGVSRWHVSITHTTTVAVAMVVAEE